MVTYRGGRPVNEHVRLNFTRTKDPDRAVTTATCNHCFKERSWHTSLLELHLNKCQPYLASLTSNQRQLQTPIGKSSQMRLAPSKVKDSRAQRIRLSFAMAVYMNNRPFTSYDDQWTNQALGEFNLDIKYPSRKELAGPLLQEAFTQVKSQVTKKIFTAPGLNLITDESSNIRKERI